MGFGVFGRERCTVRMERIVQRCPVGVQAKEVLSTTGAATFEIGRLGRMERRNDITMVSHTIRRSRSYSFGETSFSNC